MKKQFFTTAIASIAALSLSVSAFAANDSGESDSGWSDAGYSEGSDKAGIKDGSVAVLIGEKLEVAVKFVPSDFDSDIAEIEMSVVAKSAAAMTAAEKDAAAADLTAGADAWKDTRELNVLAQFEIDLTGYKADGTKVDDLQPKSGKTLEVVFTNDDDVVNKANAVVDPLKQKTNDNKKLLLGFEKNRSQGTSKFVTNHFSTYYTVQVSELLGNRLLGNGDEPENPGNNDTPTNPGNSGFEQPGTSGGNNNNDSNNSSNNNNNQDSNNNSGNSGNNGDNDSNFNFGFEGGKDDVTGTNNSGNTTGADVSDGNNSNVGNDGAGAGADKNMGTGVVLTVIPAAIAAAAVVLSKKRK